MNVMATNTRQLHTDTQLSPTSSLPCRDQPSDEGSHPIMWPLDDGGHDKEKCISPIRKSPLGIDWPGLPKRRAQRPEYIPATVYIGAQLDRPNSWLPRTQQDNTEINTAQRSTFFYPHC